MGLQHFLFTALMAFGLASNARAQNAEVFVASSPCSKGTRPLPGIPATADCELIKWKMILIKDSFTLHCIYGIPKQGTNGFIGGGTAVDLKGKWHMTHGMATDSSAIVYRLVDGKTHSSISFVKLSDDVLHLLDSDNHLMIGSPAWSYTLNRISH